MGLPLLLVSSLNLLALPTADGREAEAGFYVSQYRHDDPYFHHKEMAEALLGRGDKAGALKSFAAHMRFYNSTASVEEWIRLATFHLEQGTEEECLQAAEIVQKMIEVFGTYNQRKWQGDFMKGVAVKFQGEALERTKKQVQKIFDRKIPHLKDHVSKAEASASPPHAFRAPELVRRVDDVWDFVASSEFWNSFLERAPVVMRPKKTPKPALTVQQFAQKGLRLVADGVFAKRGNFHSDPPPQAQLTHGAVIDEAALKRAWTYNMTTFAQGMQKFFPPVAALVDRVAASTALRCNAVVYISGPQQEKGGLEVHNDDKSVYVAQQQGSKRWRVWTRAAFFLPTAANVGRGIETELGIDMLGEPDLDVELQPGDVIYVPRGALHCTSTAHSTTEPSLSLTLTSVHSHFEWPFAFGVFAGSAQQDDERAAQWLNHARFRQQWFDASRSLAKKSLDFKRLLPHEFWFGGSRWREDARKHLHSIVDELVDSTDFLDLLQSAWHAEQSWSPPSSTARRHEL